MENALPLGLFEVDSQALLVIGRAQFLQDVKHPRPGYYRQSPGLFKRGDEHPGETIQFWLTGLIDKIDNRCRDANIGLGRSAKEGNVDYYGDNCADQEAAGNAIIPASRFPVGVC